MENNLEVIPIFFAVDDIYTPFLSVTLESLIANASDKYYYSIKVLYTNIKEENKRKILKYEKSNVKIEFVDLNYYIEGLKDKLYTRDYYTKTTYFRLFIPNLYPQYTKAIYLDCDIVVLGDISKLYNQHLGDNLVAAVPDDVIQTTKVFQEYVERVLGMTSYKKYFNAGILLMNLDALRKFNFQDKFIYMLETVKYTVAQDQDYLNRLCKGRVKLLDYTWNRMPIAMADAKEDEINIVHYNLSYKPWHFDNIMYEKYFWDYASRTDFYDKIKKMKENYTEEERFNDMEQYKKLKDLAVKETACVGDDRKQKWYKTYLSKDDSVNKYESRLEILKRIEQLEREGTFDKDVEDDPPTVVLEPDQVDYLNRKSTSKIKTKIANKMGEVFLNDILKDDKLIIKDVKGLEILQKVKTGALITCNHFNPFDSFAIEKAFRMAGQDKIRKLYKVIREGNYTNFPGLYGFFFRNCDTLPLSSNKRTMIEFMKSVEVILNRNDFILIYPEQSMWWNYKKPKPLKEGAFKIAVKNNVPVIPIFITMTDSDIVGDDGFKIQQYVVNIEEPIYPDKNLKEKENVKYMRDKNYEIWKNVYENFYNIPLEYTTENKEEFINE